MIQKKIIEFISKHSPYTLTDMAAHPMFRGDNFGNIMKSVDVLKKRGILSVENGDTSRGQIISKGPKFKTASITKSLIKIATDLKEVK
jgi:hypothetical protein